MLNYLRVTALFIQELPLHVGNFMIVIFPVIFNMFPSSHYVQQATSEKKRSSTVPRRPRNLTSANSRYVSLVVFPLDNPLHHQTDTHHRRLLDKIVPFFYF